MKFLPTELGTIVFKYQHNLNMNEVLEELEDCFSTCDYCEHNININKLTFCRVCRNEICDDCYEYLIEDGLCNECHYDQIIFIQIEEMIERDTNMEEFEIICRCVCRESEYIKTELLDLLYFLQDVIEMSNFKAIMSEMREEVRDIIDWELEN